MSQYKKTYTLYVLNITITINIKTMENKFIKTGRGNEVLNFDWGYISYNPDTSTGNPMAGFFSMLGDSLGIDSEEETALVIDGKFKILKGDFRREYEKCRNKEEALEIYNKNIDQKSDWSTE